MYLVLIEGLKSKPAHIFSQQREAETFVQKCMNDLGVPRVDIGVWSLGGVPMMYISPDGGLS